MAGRAAVAEPGGRSPGGSGEPQAAARPAAPRSGALENVKNIHEDAARMSAPGETHVLAMSIRSRTVLATSTLLGLRPVRLLV
jgi:hypothetical protein